MHTPEKHISLSIIREFETPHTLVGDLGGGRGKRWGRGRGRGGGGAGEGRDRGRGRATGEGAGPGSGAEPGSEAEAVQGRGQGREPGWGQGELLSGVCHAEQDKGGGVIHESRPPPGDHQVRGLSTSLPRRNQAAQRLLLPTFSILHSPENTTMSSSSRSESAR